MGSGILFPLQQPFDLPERLWKVVFDDVPGAGVINLSVPVRQEIANADDAARIGVPSKEDGEIARNWDGASPTMNYCRSTAERSLRSRR